MANKVVFGLENVYIAMLTEDTVTYGTPTHIPGAVKLTMSPEGGDSNFYADNVAYFTSTQNNGYKGELEMALVPDSVLADILGWGIDSNDMLVEISDAQPQPFALLFEVEGNEARKRYVLYKCVASRPKEEHGTKGEKADPATAALSLTITPIDIDGTWVVKGVIERATANAAAFDAWFNAVTKPVSIVS